MIWIDTLLWSIFTYICSWIGLISILTYVIILAAQQICMKFPQNLKKKYNADWALVTGSSSGIGKAIAEKLAEQGVSVVLVALDDPLLANTFTELQAKYPSVQFRKCGVNLGAKDYGYMPAIIEATKDIHIALLFNNAGYILTGLIAETELERLRTNLECNAGCAVPITHHFLKKMLEKRAKDGAKGRSGLITFTSSASCYLPGPTATLYSPSKAFLTNFASTLAAENHDVGIDVSVIHPSPVNTNFYKNEGPQLDSLKTAQKAAASPANIADQLFASAGRLTVWDQGVTCGVFRVVNKILDFQLFTEIVTRFAFLNGDHKKLRAGKKTQ